MNRKLPPLNALLAFETAARCGRMTQAAQELSVTPGAISRQVKNLEAWLGQPLFEGTKNSPVLSAVGIALLPRLRLAFDQLHTAVHDARGDNANVVRVSCYNTLAAKWLLPRLHALPEAHPTMDVQLSASAEVDRLRLHTFDVAILAEPADAPIEAGLARTALFDEQMGPVVSPSLKKQGALKRPIDVLKLPLLHTQTRADAWDIWAAHYALRAPKARKTTRYQHYYFTIEAALRGQGVCIAPLHLVNDDIKAGRLVAPLGFVPTHWTYVALHAANARPVVKQFCDWLAA
jgi:LysR family transcriptional regulator, glycine cleavage system transcriptional activator